MPTFLLFSFKNRNFICPNIFFALKLKHLDINDSLLFLLFLFNFCKEKKIRGLRGHVCHSLPTTTDALINRYFFSSPAWEKQYCYFVNLSVSHLSASLACNRHHENSYNLEKQSMSVTDFHLLHAPYQGHF